MRGGVSAARAAALEPPLSPPSCQVEAPASLPLVPSPALRSAGGRCPPACRRASRDLALLLASQQASSLVRSKGGPQWLADKLEGLGAGAQARGVQMPPPLA